MTMRETLIAATKNIKIQLSRTRIRLNLVIDKRQLAKLGIIVIDPKASAVYDKLFAEYKLLHDYFGRGGNDVMMRLRDIASAAN